MENEIYKNVNCFTENETIVQINKNILNKIANQIGPHNLKFHQNKGKFYI